MRIASKGMYIGSAAGGFLGVIIEFLFALKYGAQVAALLAQGGIGTIMMGAFFGGVMVGETVGLMIGGFGLVGTPLSFQLRKVPRIALWAGVHGALYGAFLWGTGGFRVTIMGFGAMGGVICGLMSGSTAGWMVGRVHETRE